MEHAYIENNTHEAPAGTQIVFFGGLPFQDGTYQSVGAGQLRNYFYRVNANSPHRKDRVIINIYQKPGTDRFYFYAMAGGRERRDLAVYASPEDAAEVACAWVGLNR